MAETSIKITKDTFSKALKHLSQGLNSPERMFHICEMARGLIITRTLKGQDETGATFQSYSKKYYWAPGTDKRPEGYPQPAGGRETPKGMAYDTGYAAYKTGISRPAFVQLSVSGQMLGDMSSRVISPTRGEIFFTSRQSAAKAHGHHTGANHLPRRPFFGLSQGNYQELVAEFAKGIQELAREAEGMA